MGYCKECFEKQLKIDRLEEEVASLKTKLRYRKDKDVKPFFGSSTTSSKLPVKANTENSNIDKKGGAIAGHKSNGRQSITDEEADEIIELKVKEECCPDCGGKLERKGDELRSIVDTYVSKLGSNVRRSIYFEILISSLSWFDLAHHLDNVEGLRGESRRPVRQTVWRKAIWCSRRDCRAPFCRSQ